MLSVIIGSLGALNQTKIKRLLAYSAIGHMGFMLLGLAPATINSLQASLVYIILYIIMSLNTFAFVLIYFNKYRSSLSISDRSNYISELSGLSRKEPVLAATFALSLLSIAGIPPLAGFFSKYFVLLSLIENSMYVISLITILFSVIACFYYIRIIQ
jgi:NADH-quinone oxidoreductase subunit N